MPECSLSPPEQTRNLILFGACTALNYLASPVTFVVVHAPLCRRLGASAKVANLPSTAYLLLAVSPVLVAWLFPRIGHLKQILVLSYLGYVAATAGVLAALMLPLTEEAKIAVLIAHGAVIGATMTVAVSLLFEILGRGVSAARRGHALAVGYGAGPACAVVGNLVGQWLLSEGTHVGAIGGYALLFGLSMPVMALAALLSGFFRVPGHDGVHPPETQGLVEGLVDYLSAPVLRRTTLAAMFVLSSLNIHDNMTLYTEHALGGSTEDYVGYQQSLRFGFKIATGLFAGWLLARAGPRSLLLLTAALGITGMLWAMSSSGAWYLLSFGFFGGGEMYSIYMINFVLACSPREHLRRNVGIAVMLFLLAAPAGPLYGAISDHVGDGESPALGFRLSFAAALAYLAVGIAVTVLLPRRPRT